MKRWIPIAGIVLAISGTMMSHAATAQTSVLASSESAATTTSTPSGPVQLTLTNLTMHEATMLNVIHENNLSLQQFQITFQPKKQELSLLFDSAIKGTLKVRVFDVAGNEIFSEKLKGFTGKYDQTVDLSQGKGNVYVINIKHGGRALSKKVTL